MKPMCYFINVFRQRPVTSPLAGDAVHICRIHVSFVQSGTLMRHLAATAFPANKGYVLELFREDRKFKHVEHPEVNTNVHL